MRIVGYCSECRRVRTVRVTVPTTTGLNIGLCNDCDETMSQVPEDLECLDSHGESLCYGRVEYRSVGDGKAWPRCVKHFGLRLEREEEIRRRYPAMQPSDFDPDYAGERWDDDY